VVAYLLLFMMLGVMLPGCERKQVYIPPEYCSPAVSPSYSAPRQAEPSVDLVRPAAIQAQGSGQMLSPGTPGSALSQERVVAQSETTSQQNPPKRQKKEEAAGSPQRLASMQQVEQARGQLERGRTDAAIRTLEKAVRIDAGNGDAFILLARAWRQKGETRKALEFAKKAELLCQKQRSKLREVYSLESDLYRELEESTKARPKSKQ
jgi:tetratricopeptide (TPR) repeat protein